MNEPKRTMAEKLSEQERLKSFFDKVCNPDDWKAPIRAEVHTKDVNDVCEAIRFFTATEPHVFSTSNKPEHVIVRSEGYQMGPAGDH